MQLSMQGRVAVVTGASRGLGKAMAHAFAGAGASVALIARGQDVLAAAASSITTETGAKTLAVVGDVSSAQECKRIIAEVEAGLGPVDVLVNNAGSSARGVFEDISDEQWQADLDLKLFGAIRLTRLVFSGMKARRFGRVVNVLNTGAKAPPAEGAPTAVSRAAGMALTKVLANEERPTTCLSTH